MSDLDHTYCCVCNTCSDAPEKHSMEKCRNILRSRVDYLQAELSITIKTKDMYLRALEEMETLEAERLKLKDENFKLFETRKNAYETIHEKDKRIADMEAVIKDRQNNLIQEREGWNKTVMNLEAKLRSGEGKDAEILGWKSLFNTNEICINDQHGEIIKLKASLQTLTQERDVEIKRARVAEASLAKALSALIKVKEGLEICISNATKDRVRDD